MKRILFCITIIVMTISSLPIFAANDTGSEDLIVYGTSPIEKKKKKAELIDCPANSTFIGKKCDYKFIKFVDRQEGLCKKILYRLHFDVTSMDKIYHLYVCPYR